MLSDDGRDERSVVVDLVEGDVVVVPLSLEVPLWIVVPLELPELEFLSGVTLREEVPLCTVPLSVVPDDLSDTLREDVPLCTVPFSLRVVLVRDEPSLLLEDTLEPVTMRPLASLLTLRDDVPAVALLVDRLLTLESYDPRFVERTDV